MYLFNYFSWEILLYRNLFHSIFLVQLLGLSFLLPFWKDTNKLLSLRKNKELPQKFSYLQKKNKR